MLFLTLRCSLRDLVVLQGRLSEVVGAGGGVGGGFYALVKIRFPPQNLTQRGKLCDSYKLCWEMGAGS